MIIGYARVSTDDENPDAQTDALQAVGAERIFSDKISGTKRDRTELGVMLDQLRPSDVVVVAKYDRLAGTVALIERFGESLAFEEPDGAQISLQAPPLPT